MIPTTVIKALEERERTVDKARAAVDAGATRIEFAGDLSGLIDRRICGERGDRMLSRETRIRLGDARTDHPSAGRAAKAPKRYSPMRPMI